MFLKSTLLAIVVLMSLDTNAQTQLSSSDMTNAYQLVSYPGRISCHDPSVVVDNITDASSPKYYIYGSHLGRGYTTAESNYASWSTFKVGEEATDATNSLFANTSGTLVNYADAYSTHKITSVKNYQGSTVTFGNFDAYGWQYTGYTVAGNQWAPDIIYNKKMKKWCLYMSLNGDKWCSSIVCFTSDNIEGPWVYQGPVIFSGFSGTYKHNSYAASNDWKYTDLAIATGCTSLPTRYNVGSSWGTYWPNCIDPCVFYDDSGKLWMSYGSWSGGIFIIRLNEDNGLRDYTCTYDYEVDDVVTTPGSANANCTSDPYFGKKIAGGYYVSGEASYIEKIGSYYYLFTSYGGFASTGGYQMRVFRSSSPDGPYVDAWGTNAIFKSYLLNYSQDGNDGRGVLLFSGYKWDLMPAAEICQGHNSAFTDLAGRSFVVCHTRFNDGTEGHSVRVHQLFVNQDGWIMAAPYEFSGETITQSAIASTASIDDSDIPGNYQLIRHQYFQDTENKAYESPVDIELTSDGKVQGDETGTWERVAGTDYINITLNNVVHKGVLVKQTIDYSNIPAICIAAISSSSGAVLPNTSAGFTFQQEIWASKADYKGAIRYTVDKNKPAFTSGSTITSDVTLPATPYLGTTIAWSSSNTSVISNSGVVGSNGTATLTMTVSKDGYQYQNTYDITVSKNGTESIVLYPESSYKNTTSAWWSNFSRNDYTLAQGKTLHFKFFNYTDQAAAWCSWCLYGASATHGASGYTEYFGIRNDNWDNTSGSNTGCSCTYDWGTFLADMNGSYVDMTVNYTTAGVFTMSSTITTTAGKTYTYNYTKTISDKPSSICLFFVSQESYIDGSMYKLTAVDNSSNTLQTLSTGYVDANGTATVYYPHVLKADGSYYEKAQNASTPYYGTTVGGGLNTVAYTLNDSYSYYAEETDAHLNGKWRGQADANDCTTYGMYSNGTAHRLQKNSYLYTDAMESGVYTFGVCARNYRSDEQAAPSVYLRDASGNLYATSSAYSNWSGNEYKEATVSVNVPNGYSVVLNNASTINSNCLELTYLYLKRTSDLTYTVTIPSSGIGSYSCPDNLDIAGATSTTAGAESLSAYYASSKESSYIYLKGITQVPAGEGIIIAGTPGATYTIPVCTSDIAAISNLFTGTSLGTLPVTSDMTQSDTYYVVSSGALKYIDASSNTVTIPSYKAYLKVSNSAAAKLVFKFEGDDVSTGIRSFTSSAAAGSAYNLAGQRIDGAYKGIVIRSGRKSVQK